MSPRRSSSGPQVSALRSRPSHHQPPPSPWHKQRRPFGDPLAAPKFSARYEPPPPTNNVNLKLPLQVVASDVAQTITAAGQLTLHMVGDTGGLNGTDTQEAVAHQMEAQMLRPTNDRVPRFFYHLGDVIYYNGQSWYYRPQFYEPYQYYPGPIFAIPGNHDGDNHPHKNDPPDPEPSLRGFMENFCDTQPQNTDFPHRPTMTQPYVYWTLDAPFATIIGLYSNVDGLLDARGRNEQQGWLEQQLRDAATDKCLLVTVHHPPYSLDWFHGGNPDILSALDEAFQHANRFPHAIFSAHVHSYQRFTRKLADQEIPYFVAGAGGFANAAKSLHALQKDPATGAAISTSTPFQTTEPGVTLRAYDETNAGFLRVTIDANKLVAEYYSVPFPGGPGGSAPRSAASSGRRGVVAPPNAPPLPSDSEPPATLVDTCTLDLKQHTVAD